MHTCDFHSYHVVLKQKILYKETREMW